MRFLSGATVVAVVHEAVLAVERAEVLALEFFDRSFIPLKSPKC